MGYTTDFSGKFKINKPVDEDTYNLLEGIAATRRMKRSGLDKKYGVDGEFYFEKEDFGNCGQSDKPKLGKIVDFNKPPKTQPGLWCQWQIQKDKQTIEWDQGEKFYSYIEWIKYLIKTILEPRGYKLNGEVEWFGEEQGDTGFIIVKDNIVTVKRGRIVYD